MKTTEMIETYLEGNLKGLELDEFQKLMKEDASFSNKVKLHDEINMSIKDDDLQDFRQLLGKMMRKRFSSKIRYINIISSAAAAVFLITVSIFSLTKVSSIDKVYNDFYAPYQTDLYSRSANVDTRNFEQGYFLYQKGEYVKAFKLFDKYKTVQNNCTAQFYYGLCALEVEKYDITEQSMLTIIKENDSPFSLHAKWYLSLLYLKTDRTSKAIPILKELAAYDNYYSVKAESVLKRY